MAKRGRPKAAAAAAPKKRGRPPKPTMTPEGEVLLEMLKRMGSDIYGGLCSEGKAIVQKAAKTIGFDLAESIGERPYYLDFYGVEFNMLDTEDFSEADFDITGSITVTHVPSGTVRKYTGAQLHSDLSEIRDY